MTELFGPVLGWLLAAAALASPVLADGGAWADQDQLDRSLRQDVLVDQLDHLVEMDRRRLSLEYASLRAYLVTEYGMEEWMAERKIRIARLFRRLPVVREMLALGKLNPSLIEIAMGYAHREKLPDSEIEECLKTISGMSCNSAKRELATRYPNSKELPHDRVIPLTAELAQLQCVVDQECLELLDDVKGLLAHSHPGIKMGELFKVTLREFRERHHPEARARRAQARAERKASECQTEMGESPAATRVGDSEEDRFPSQSLEHQMVLLYGYQCGYIDPRTGKRCQSRHALEKDHIIPWADGGRTELSNLRFACPTHHARLSFLRFGESSRYFRACP